MRANTFGLNCTDHLFPNCSHLTRNSRVYSLGDLLAMPHRRTFMHIQIRKLKTLPFPNKDETLAAETSPGRFQFV